ncbi:hypothetical protein F4815DRAFT_143430 [Daldinia loculata]|nr:hypothetical protein F4815DRAFT_143430 [Daldinia loculata]
MPLRKHVSSKQTSESDTDDEGSDLEEVIHTKHAQSYKSSSKRHIAAKHIPVESDSEESSDPEEVAAKKKHIHTKHAPGRERKKAKKVLPLSDEDSDTLVESETDDESSESEEVAASKCTKNKHRTSNKHAPIRKTKRIAKPAPPSESESDSSQEESDTEEEEGSESEEVVAPQPSRNKKKAPAKHTSSKKKASTKKTRRVAKPLSPPSSESDSTEEESEESEEESEEDSSEDEEVTAGKEPRRDLETIQMDGYRDDDWSVYEDGMICFMKAKGNSSRKIAQELEREVSEVQIRIQEIMELAEEGGLTIERLGEIYTQDVKKNMKKRKEDAKPKHQAYAETVIDDSDEEPKTKGRGKEKAKVDDTNSNHGKGPSSVHSSSSSESLLSYGTFPPIVVPARERLDMMHTLSRLYPNQKVFYPDSNFSVQDCHALAIAEARYRGQQYSYIQSGFANLTGRYLDTEVLKAKLAQGINPYDQTYVNWGGYRQY